MGVLNRLQDVPIRRKLAIISMLTSGVALAIAGVSFLAFEQVASRIATLDRLSTTAAMVADGTAAALTFEDAGSAAETLRTLSVDAHIVTAVVYDSSGQPFASYRRPGASGDTDVPRVEPTGHRFDADSLRLFHDVTLAGERAGTVYLQYDMTEMHARTSRYALVMLAVMAAASVAGLLLANRLHAMISGPVSHLARVMGIVTAQKNYSTRAVKDGNDELGQLIDGFNAMLGQIQIQDSALQGARAELEQRVRERTQELQAEVSQHKRAQEELERVHRQLLQASRQAGMAEIATNVLHNVGNVLNSVNVSATLVAELAEKSQVAGLERVVALLDQHEHDLPAFLSADSRGRHLPVHLRRLAEHLRFEQSTTVQELDSLRTNVGHIKDIVAMQQSYAKVSGVMEIVAAAALVEDSLRINAGALIRHGVEVIRDFEGDPLLNCDKHKVLQILVNLVRNAKYACEESHTSRREMRLRVRSGEGRVCISVIDNGVGIAAENLTRIFSHGFTTRASGHGFGLHSGALAARELGGSLTVHSDGVGHGATFTLDLPQHQAAAAANSTETVKCLTA